MLRKDIGLGILVLTVGAIVALINPRFISGVNLSNTANLIGLFGLFSIAQAFVIVTAGIELSVGSVIALLGVIFVDLIAQGVPWPFAALIALVLGCVIGVLHGWLITRLKLQPFVVTLCGLLIYRGIARFYTQDGTAGFPFGSSFPTLEYLATGRTLGVPHPFIAFLVVACAAWFLLHRTVFGRHLFAVGKNEEAARFSGINTRRVIVLAYVICAMLTASSAIFFAMYTRSVQPSSHGNFYELYAIAAAVLGGFSLRGGEGSIVGVCLGVVLLQVLQNLVNLLGIPSSLNFAVMGGVILAGVIADTQFERYRTARMQTAMRTALD
ncbi:ABC transporter permease, partial [Marivita sp.]|uniref:ABC transporter permease n=1 Tax=Marivita sp. TaxID=2003365 RepID=UPI003F72AB16